MLTSYNRAWIFRISADGKEIVGLTETGNALRIPAFCGYRFPASETLFHRVQMGGSDDQEIAQGPGYQAHEFGKELCREYMEFILRDPQDRRILGTMVVDDVVDPALGSNRVYSEEDLFRLRPIANYVAQILSVEARRERDQVLEHHAKVIRSLETEADEKLSSLSGKASREDASDLQRFFARMMRKILRREPGLAGFHLRFASDDGFLKLYRGIGPYSKLGKAKQVSPNDANSLSAQCYRDNMPKVNISAHNYGPFLNFYKYIKQFAEKEPELVEAVKWCEQVKVLGCFPIRSGATKLGTIAIQSHASDFFSTDSVQFVKDLCSSIARVLGPIRQEQDHFDLWEKVAYSFRGPASNMLDIAKNRWMHEQVQAEKIRVEGEYALAQYLFTKASTIHLGSYAPREIMPEKREVNIVRLWDDWCGVFRGISRYGSKNCDVLVGDSTIRSLERTTFTTDKILLTEVVYNIFENALKACNSKVKITAELHPGEFVVNIDDDGNGISDTAYENMWRGYHEDFEIDATRGLGLGLKYSKRNADLLGVTLVSKRKGKLGGATFRIIVPFEGR